MSATPQLVLDNRINVSPDFSVLVNYSGNQISQYRIKADGSSFTDQILFENIVVPSMATTLVSRNIRINYQVGITYPFADALAPNFAGVRNGTAGLVDGDVVDCSLRAFPLQSISDNVQLVINGSTISQRTRDILDPLLLTMDKDYLYKQASECPSMLDNAFRLKGDVEKWGSWTAVANWANTVDTIVTQTQTRYSNTYTFTLNAVGVAGTVPTAGVMFPLAVSCNNALVSVGNLQAYLVLTANWAVGVVGTIYVQRKQSNQPLSVYENSDGSSRGSFRAINSSLNGGDQTVLFNVTETILMSPLTQRDRENYLGNINTMSMLLTYSKLSSDMFYCNHELPAGVTVSIPQAPELLLQYIQIDPNIVKIPPSITYSYEQPIVQKKIESGLNYGATFSSAVISSQNLRFQAMPELIFICTRKQMTTRASVDTATLNSLGKAMDANSPAGLQLSINNRQNLLSSATNSDLYRIAVSNGYRYSFNQWLRHTVYIINPTKDLGLNPEVDTLVFEAGNVNFDVQFYENNYGRLCSGYSGSNDTTTECVVIPIYKGSLSITPSTVFNSLAIMSPNEMNQVLKAQPKDGSMVSSEAVQPTIDGEGLFSTVKSLLGHTASALSSPLGQSLLGKASDMLN